jgi:hypothetical protein
MTKDELKELEATLQYCSENDLPFIVASVYVLADTVEEMGTVLGLISSMNVELHIVEGEIGIKGID